MSDPAIDVDGVWTSVYNISLGGMCIGTIEPLKMGWRRRFTLRDRETGREWTLPGEVVWVNPVSNELTRVGVKWLDLSPEAAAWLESHVEALECGD